MPHPFLQATCSDSHPWCLERSPGCLDSVFPAGGRSVSSSSVITAMKMGGPELVSEVVLAS